LHGFNVFGIDVDYKVLTLVVRLVTEVALEPTGFPIANLDRLQGVAIAAFLVDGITFLGYF
jgi:hypothetical protein